MSERRRASHQHGVLLAPAVGRRLPTVVTRVDRQRLVFFAKAIGEIDPVYSDVDTARAAGHPDLPVPPTFLFGLTGDDGGDLLGWLAEYGVDVGAVLHGEQRFVYHRLAHAGQELTLSPTVSDAYSRKGGALQFVVTDTAVHDAEGAPIAELRETLVLRDAAVTA